MGRRLNGRQRKRRAIRNSPAQLANALDRGNLEKAYNLIIGLPNFDPKPYEQILLGLWAQSSKWCLFGGCMDRAFLYGILRHVQFIQPDESDIPERVAKLFQPPPYGYALVGACPRLIRLTDAGESYFHDNL